MNGELAQRERFLRATRTWLKGFLPARAQTDRSERIRACCGALIGIFITAVTAYWLIGPSEYLPVLIAPIGASAVLLFAVPSGPLAQPWPLVGGNTVSALIGVTALMFIDNMALAAALAVAGAIGAMFVLRCLHPPGGAVALTTVLGGDFVLEQGYAFAFSPVALESMILLAAGIVYNNLTGRPYPNPQSPAQANPHRTGDAQPGTRTGFTEADLEVVLARYEHFIDISRSDLATILKQTEMQAYRRRMGEITCADIMSRDLVTADYDTPLAHAWGRLQFHRIKALPVTDADGRVIGILTLVDFLKQAKLDRYEGFREKLVDFLKRTSRGDNDEPTVVGDIMTRNVETARANEHIATLVPKLSDHGRHHIPIVDDADRLIGIVTQSDLVAALYRGTQSVA